MQKQFVYIILLLIVPFLSLAQHHVTTYEVPAPHKHFAHFRVAVLLGHTLIPEEHAGENFFIPSWSLDLEYWGNHRWGVGLHSDMEIETFVILNYNDAGQELNRVTPLVITLDALYRPYKGLILQFGPGVELEREENYTLVRAGLEYEFVLGNHWDVAPTIFYDRRFDGYHTWSFAFGVGKRF